MPVEKKTEYWVEIFWRGNWWQWSPPGKRQEAIQDVAEAKASGHPNARVVKVSREVIYP